MIIGDVAVLPERVKRELIRGEHARAEFAIRAQTALKEAMGQMGPMRHIEGIGRKVTTIHPELAARIRVKYGTRCLHDPDFLRALLRDNPFLRVQCVPAALTLRVNGMRDAKCEMRDGESRNPQPASRIPKHFQNGSGNGASGDPGTASARSAERGSLSSPERGSAHETPAHSGNEMRDAGCGMRVTGYGMREGVCV